MIMLQFFVITLFLIGLLHASLSPDIPEEYHDMIQEQIDNALKQNRQKKEKEQREKVPPMKNGISPMNLGMLRSSSNVVPNKMVPLTPQVLFTTISSFYRLKKLKVDCK